MLLLQINHVCTLVDLRQHFYASFTAIHVETGYGNTLALEKGEQRISGPPTFKYHGNFNYHYTCSAAASIRIIITTFTPMPLLQDIYIHKYLIFNNRETAKQPAFHQQTLTDELNINKVLNRFRCGIDRPTLYSGK